MVSSFCDYLDSHRPLAHWAAIVFFPLQPRGEGGRFGLFPGSRIAIYDPRWLAGLRGNSFLSRLVSLVALHTTACRRDVVVSWPSLCIVTWSVTTPTPVCLVSQVGKSFRVGKKSLCLSCLEAAQTSLARLIRLKGLMMHERICLADSLSQQGK